MPLRTRPGAANARQEPLIHSLDPERDGHHPGGVGGQPATKARPGSREAGAPVERFAQPVILAEAPADIGHASPASALVHAGGHLHATVHEDWHLASAHTVAAVAGKAASWYSHGGGIKSVAQAGSHTLQAHTGPLEILADQSITVTSSQDEIHLLARNKIVLQAGQSSVTLEGQNITFACPGTFSVKGSGQAFKGPGRAPAELEALPTGVSEEMPNWIEIIHRDVDGEPFAGQGYAIYFENGQVIRGTLDGNAFARHENVPNAASHVEYAAREPLPDKPWDALEKLVGAARQKLG